MNQTENTVYLIYICAPSEPTHTPPFRERFAHAARVRVVVAVRENESGNATRGVGMRTTTRNTALQLRRTTSGLTIRHTQSTM